MDEYLISGKLSLKDFKLTAALRLAISLTQINDMPRIQGLKDTFVIRGKILVSKYGSNEKIESIAKHLISNLTILIITLTLFTYVNVRINEFNIENK